MGYDDQYEKIDALFGREPEESLRLFHTDLEMGPILDVGAGQGRHAFWLADEGHVVHALEPSKVACAGLRKHGGLKVINGVFADLEVPAGGYAGVLVFGLVPDLTHEGIDELRAALARWTRPGSLVWLTGFTTADPAIGSFRKKWREMGPNSFSNDQGRVRTYLEPGEIVTLFPGWSVVQHQEYLGPEHRHGDSPPERHAIFDVVFRV